jgi:hypothetical protein
MGAENLGITAEINLNSSYVFLSNETADFIMGLLPGLQQWERISVRP